VRGHSGAQPLDELGLIVAGIASQMQRHIFIERDGREPAVHGQQKSTAFFQSGPKIGGRHGLHSRPTSTMIEPVLILLRYEPVAQCTGDPEIEERQFPGPFCHLQPYPDRPDFLGLEGSLLSDQLSLVPRLSPVSRLFHLP